MKNLIRRRNIVLAIVGLVVVGIGMMAMSGAGGMLVEMETVDKGLVRDIIEEEAQVTSRQSKNVAVLVSGTVNEWHKDIGDNVEEGDLLATIDMTDIDNEIAIANEQLSALKYTFEDALEPNDREQIRQAESSYNAAVISRDGYASTHDKNEKLFEQGAVSSQNIQDSKNALDLAQEDVNAKYQALIQLRKGLSDALKNKYASEIKAKEAAINVLEVTKARHEIRANETGVILNRYIEAGDYVTTGKVTFEIANILHVYFKSDILDSDVSEISVGSPVIIHLNDDERIDGRVSKVFPKAETQVSDLGIEQKRVTVEIESSVTDIPVLIGQELDVDFITVSKEGVVRIREELTYQREGMYYVFVESEGLAIERAVETGLVGETYVEVLSGLVDGDQVIVPEDDLSPDMKVKLEE